MAKESDLEKIELKVSVNCCDGCKKKVKKVLQSIEGVLKIEVDSQRAKVTVIGNVDPQKLIKRLSKMGKQAEVWKYGNQNAAAMEKKGEIIMPAPDSVPKEKEQKSTLSNDLREQAKPSSGGNHTRKDEGADNGTKKKELINKMGDSNFPISAHSEEKGDKLPETDMIGNGRTYSYSGTQYALTVPLPCYAVAVPSYAYTAAAPPLLSLPQTCCNQEYYCQQPQLLNTPTTRVGDYFSDENTLGCTVM